MILRTIARKRRLLLATVAVFAVAGFLQMVDANPAASQALRLTALATDNDPGLDPWSSDWDRALPVNVPLTAQAAAYPTGGGSVPTISARALHYADNLYIRVEWGDSTQDDSTTRVEDFADAVAVEFPARTAATVPSICMGQADAGVNIWQWRADSQKGLQDPVDVYAGALVDGYPSKDTLYYTARQAGNPYAQPGAGPIQTLISQTFGTLTPANVQDVHGQGEYQDGRWAVVFTRAYSGADSDQASFTNGASTDMAIAVWNGSQGDRNGRKSVSQFVTLSIGTELAQAPSGNSMTVVIALVMLGGFVVAGIGLGAYGLRQGGRER